MNISVSVVLTLACLYQMLRSKCNGHGHDLKNVAYSKNVTLSSRFSSSRFKGWKAVNGLFNDFAHTGRERFPWLRIDLGANFFIHEIEVFARSDCCADQLHDIDVKVGKHPRRRRMCGHYSGYTYVGGRMAVWCPTPTIGRYVQIQIVKGTSNYLTPAEVIVWGKPV